jgi:predicted ATP-grasp superfamily ATP-dependent carboligase
LGEEVRSDFVLEETLRLFRSVNYRGLGYVEFKKSSSNGQYYIVEPNVGRPTGRSAIAEAGGVEMLLTMYCDVVGLPLPEKREQKFSGAKWIDLRHDFQSALYYFRKGELSLTDWYRSWKGPKAHTYFAWSDPAPFFFDLMAIPRRLFVSEERKKREYLSKRERSAGQGS